MNLRHKDVCGGGGDGRGGGGITCVPAFSLFQILPLVAPPAIFQLQLLGYV